MYVIYHVFSTEMGSFVLFRVPHVSKLSTLPLRDQTFLLIHKPARLIMQPAWSYNKQIPGCLFCPLCLVATLFISLFFSLYIINLLKHEAHVPPLSNYRTFVVSPTSNQHNTTIPSNVKPDPEASETLWADQGPREIWIRISTGCIGKRRS